MSIARPIATAHGPLASIPKLAAFTPRGGNKFFRNNSGKSLKAVRVGPSPNPTPHAVEESDSYRPVCPKLQTPLRHRRPGFEFAAASSILGRPYSRRGGAPIPRQNFLSVGS